jgi:putative intracellular protease/amidase
LKQRTVGILLFNEVEVLDFAGPFEVFSITTLTNSSDKPFVVKTISETGDMISARYGLKIQPDYCFNTYSSIDVLIIPGGYGAEEIEIHNPRVINWICDQYRKVGFLTSVCTLSSITFKSRSPEQEKSYHALDGCRSFRKGISFSISSERR